MAQEQNYQVNYSINVDASQSRISQSFEMSEA